MKKLFSIVLAVVMVLSIASVAMASWNKPTGTNAGPGDLGYTITIKKYSSMTAVLGSENYAEDANVNAAHGNKVWFSVEVVKGDPSPDVDAKLKLTLEFRGMNLADKDVDTGKLASELVSKEKHQTYYLVNTNYGDTRYTSPKWEWKSSNEVAANGANIIDAFCTNTKTISVEGKLSANIVDLSKYNYVGGGCFVKTDANGVYGGQMGPTKTVEDVAYFELGADDAVTKVSPMKDITSSETNRDQYYAVLEYFANVDKAETDAKISGRTFEKWCNEGDKIYMPYDNLLASFAHYLDNPTPSKDRVEWNANTLPVIKDGIDIPKTGDNTSVIGFAMIMVAVIAAAVAVKKVNA